MNRINGLNREIDPELKQYKDIQIVKKCVVKADLTPVEFITSNELIELDFDLLFEDVYICHIYKTWKDPGFRIGKVLSFYKVIPDFKNKILKIFKICTNNFISFEPKEEGNGKVCLTLEIGIFADGFNEKVLRNAIEVLEEAVKRIKAVLEE